jgi:hypothetical protein
MNSLTFAPNSGEEVNRFSEISKTLGLPSIIGSSKLISSLVINLLPAIIIIIGLPS